MAGRLILALTAMLGLLAGCYAPTSIECKVRCGPGNSCPTDQHCLTDGYCHSDNHLCPVVDAAVDAPIDAQCDCTGGTCRNGVCCHGCWRGLSCESGASVSSCGTAGADCTDCADTNECTEDTCLAGICNNKPAVGACNGGHGVCRSDGMCGCGLQGEPCCPTGTACQPGQGSCTNGTCGSCGAPNQPCCPGNVCASGTICNGTNCIPCGQVHQACCTGTTACQAYLTCTGAGGTCECGAFGQACCSGTGCNTNLACNGARCDVCGARNQLCCPAGDPMGPCHDLSLQCISGDCQCGAQGQSCCSANAGSPPCNMNLMCDQSQTCSPICGMPGQPCCNGLCVSPYVCNGTTCGLQTGDGGTACPDGGGPPAMLGSGPICPAVNPPPPPGGQAASTSMSLPFYP